MKSLIFLFAALTLTACAPSSEKSLERPEPISQQSPEYPYYAAKNRIPGEVKFNYDVDAEGKVSQMRIIESNPDHLFDEAAIKAVSTWRFKKDKPFTNLPMTLKFYMK